MGTIMTVHHHRLPRCVIGEGFTTPTPDNENLPLMDDDFVLTPAELMQWARREKKRLSRALAADPRLWSCPQHRRDWNATIGIEQITLRQCFGILDAS